jgi:hypothetical protein
MAPSLRQAQLLKNFPLLYVTRRLITMFTRTHHHPNPVHTIPNYFSKIDFYTILQPTYRSSQWPLSIWLSSQSPACIPFLFCACYMHCLSHPSWPDHFNYVWQEYKLYSTLFNFLQLGIPFFLDSNILLSILFSNTLSLCSSLNVTPSSVD